MPYRLQADPLRAFTIENTMTKEERELLILIADLVFEGYVAQTTILCQGDDEAYKAQVRPVRQRLAKLTAILQTDSAGGH